MVISMGEDTYKAVRKRLGLPDYLISLVTKYPIRGFKFPAFAANGKFNQRKTRTVSMLLDFSDRSGRFEGFLFKTEIWAANFILLAMTHDSIARISIGLAIVLKGYNVIPEIQERHRALGCQFLHPLVFPVIFLDRKVMSELENLLELHIEVDNLATMIGMYR